MTGLGNFTDNILIKMNTFCPCNSKQLFSDCCEAIIKGEIKAESAEKLMRSRYTAYTISDIHYLLKTTHPSQRKHYSPMDMEKWAKESKWQRLEIINATENTVEFKAYYLNRAGEPKIHYEKSTFVFQNGEWLYMDGIYK